MDRFSFSLGQEVRLVRSGETGVVVGRAEYTDSAPSYYVRYAAGDGRLDERWWAQSALEAAASSHLAASQA